MLETQAGHRSVQHGEPGANRERQQAILGSTGDLGQRQLHLLG